MTKVLDGSCNPVVVPLSCQKHPVPPQVCFGSEERAGFPQSLPTEDVALHCQTAALIIVQQNSVLPELLFKNAILIQQVFNDFLLLRIHSACKDLKAQLPGLQDDVHDRPVGERKHSTMPRDLPVVNAGSQLKL